MKEKGLKTIQKLFFSEDREEISLRRTLEPKR